jgi:hypothetical protein
MSDYAELHQRLWRLISDMDGRLDAGAKALVEQLLGQLQAEGYELTPDLSSQLTDYLDTVSDGLRQGIQSAIALGSPKAMADTQILALAQRAYTEQWPDGQTLSQRLWGFRQNFRQGFTDVLSQGARTGRSVSGLVYDLQRQIEAQSARFQIAHGAVEDWATALADAGRSGLHTPEARRQWNKMVSDVRAHLDQLAETGTRHAAETAFKKIRAAVGAGNAAAIDEAVAWWMYDKQLYLLKRIARTEMATAQHRAVIASASDDPDVIGFQWRLSSSHPEPDICDYYANIEMGLGKGVWPKDQAPRHKAHPHCMCLLIPRVTPVRQKGAVNYAEFIQGVSPERRAALLPKWAREAMAAGTPLETLLRPDGLGLVSRKDAHSAGIVERPAASPAEVRAFVARALRDRTAEAKLELGKFMNHTELAAQIGTAAHGLNTVVLQASYLRHAFDNHGPSGLRKDKHPLTEGDLALALAVINAADRIEFSGAKRTNGNWLVKFEKAMDGIVHKVIAEVRPGKRNRNLAVYNYYKR